MIERLITSVFTDVFFTRLDPTRRRRRCGTRHCSPENRWSCRRPDSRVASSTASAQRLDVAMTISESWRPGEGSTRRANRSPWRPDSRFAISLENGNYGYNDVSFTRWTSSSSVLWLSTVAPAEGSARAKDSPTWSGPWRPPTTAAPSAKILLSPPLCTIARQVKS